MKNINESENLLSVAETAKFLRVSEATIWRKLGNEKLKHELGCYRIGGRVVISLTKHIEPYLAKCEQKAQLPEDSQK